MNKILTTEELQALADSVCCDPGSSLDEMYRSEGMITLDDPSAPPPPKPYGTLASLQERLHADAAYGKQHLLF